jgi:hypothetical protein
VPEIDADTSAGALPPPLAQAERKRRRRVLLGAGAVLAVLCTVAAVVGATTHERRLERRAVELLGSAGYGGQVVEADGSSLRVSGARSEEDALAIAALLDGLDGARHVDVVSPADAAGVPLTEPGVPRLRASLTSGRLVLTGQTPTRAMKSSLLVAARRQVGADWVTDQLRVADAAAPSVHAEADMALFTSLVDRMAGELVTGEVALEDRTLTVRGMPSASRRASGLRELLNDARRRDSGLTVIEDLDELPGGAGSAGGRAGSGAGR